MHGRKPTGCLGLTNGKAQRSWRTILSVGVAYLAIILAVAGCASSSNRTRRRDDPDEDMRATIRALVPRGTPVDEAQRIMEAHGFACEFHRQESFDERSNRNDTLEPPLPVIDYLRCRKVENNDWLVADVWTVALVTKQGRTGAILLRHEFIGP